MNLREANVMRSKLTDLAALQERLRLNMETLESRVKLLEDALARIPQERANDQRRARGSYR